MCIDYTRQTMSDGIVALYQYRWTAMLTLLQARSSYVPVVTLLWQQSWSLGWMALVLTTILCLHMRNSP